jgi:hypothetical protein
MSKKRNLDRRVKAKAKKLLSKLSEHERQALLKRLDQRNADQANSEN